VISIVSQQLFNFENRVSIFVHYYPHREWHDSATRLVACPVCNLLCTPASWESLSPWDAPLCMLTYMMLFPSCSGWPPLW
jgi:hypothetical protein